MNSKIEGVDPSGLFSKIPSFSKHWLCPKWSHEGVKGSSAKVRRPRVIVYICLGLCDLG